MHRRRTARAVRCRNVARLGRTHRCSRPGPCTRRCKPSTRPIVRRSRSCGVRCWDCRRRTRRPRGYTRRRRCLRYTHAHTRKKRSTFPRRTLLAPCSRRTGSHRACMSRCTRPTSRETDKARHRPARYRWCYIAGAFARGSDAHRARNRRHKRPGRKRSCRACPCPTRHRQRTSVVRFRSHTAWTPARSLRCTLPLDKRTRTPRRPHAILPPRRTARARAPHSDARLAGIRVPDRGRPHLHLRTFHVGRPPLCRRPRHQPRLLGRLRRRYRQRPCSCRPCSCRPCSCRPCSCRPFPHRRRSPRRPRSRPTRALHCPRVRPSHSSSR